MNLLNEIGSIWVKVIIKEWSIPLLCGLIDEINNLLNFWGFSKLGE